MIYQWKTIISEKDNMKMSDSDSVSVMDFEYDSDDNDVTSSYMTAKKFKRSHYGNINIPQPYVGHEKEQHKTYYNSKYRNRNDYPVQQVELSCAENWDEVETSSNQNTNAEEKHNLPNLDDNTKERKNCVETFSNQKTKIEENHASSLPNLDDKRKRKEHGKKDEETYKKDKGTERNEELKSSMKYSRSLHTNKRVPEMVPEKSKDGWVLFVKSLHEEVAEFEVKNLFADYGDICNINMNMCRRTGFAEGYALIEYTTYEDALKAKESLDNTEFLGRKISVDWCFLQPPKK